MRGLAALLDKLRAASARCRRGGLALVRTMTDKGGAGASYGRFLFPAWARARPFGAEMTCLARLFPSGSLFGGPGARCPESDAALTAALRCQQP